MKMTMRLVALTIVGLLSTSISYAQQSSATHGVQADRRLPEETYAYFSFPSVTEMKKRVAASHSWKIWSDENIADFRAEVEKAMGGQFEDFASELQENFGVTPQELMNIPSGQMTLAVSEADGELGLIMFVDFGKSERVVNGLLAKAAAAMEDEGIDQTTESYEGTEINVFELPGQENNDFARSLQYCIRDTEFVLATNMELLKTAIDNWDGSDSETFNANESWAYVKERCASGNKHGMMNWFVDPVGLFDSVAALGNNPQLAMASGFLPTLGLDKLDGMGGVIDVSVGKYDTVMKTVYLCEDPSGVLKVMTLKDDKDLTPPKWVPADAAMYSSMNWNVQGAFDAIEQLVDDFAGPGAVAGQLDEIASQDPGIHIKDDIIDQITGKITIMSAADGGGAIPSADEIAAGGPAALLQGKMAVSLGCKDPEAMKKLMTRMTDMPGFGGEVREFRDTTMVEIPSPQGGNKMGMAVVGNNFMFSTDVTMLEQVARGSADSSLVEVASYKRIAAEFPSKAMSLGYTDAKQQYKSMYEGFRKGDPAEMFPGMGEMIEEIDFTKLPKFEQIAKYFLPAGSFTVGDERGAFSQSFTLKP